MKENATQMPRYTRVRARPAALNQTGARSSKKPLANRLAAGHCLTGFVEIWNEDDGAAGFAGRKLFHVLLGHCRITAE